MVEVIGREHELAASESFLASVPVRGGGLSIEGAAGIGKTILWRATVGRALAREYTVVAYRAERAEAQLSLVGLAELLSGVGEEVLGSLPGPQRTALEVVLLREPPPGGAIDARTVAVGFRSVLVELARRAPVVVAVDDVQWLDAATTRALAFAARRLEGHPVALVVTERTPSPVPDPLGLSRAIGVDRTVRLTLEPFRLATLRILLQAHFGRTYTRPTLVRIADASAGNPLFALEIARALGPSPSLSPGDPLPVPESLREVISRRIEGLPPPARETLLIAAALSRPSAELVERASSTAGLTAAEEAGLVRVEGGRVVFGHPLYASAVYTSAATARRRCLHGRLAQLVVDREERARHLALAAEAPDEGVAIALEESAATARSRGAWVSAAELLELARDLTPPGHPDQAARRGIRAAEHHVHAGDRHRARALLEALVGEELPRTARADALRLLAEVSYNDESFVEAHRLFLSAREHADDRRLVVAIDLGLSFTHASMFDFVTAGAVAYRALELAESLEHDGLIALALGFCAMFDFLTGEGLDWAKVQRALALEDLDVLLPIQWSPRSVAACLALYVGRMSDARERLTALRVTAIEMGDESDLAFIVQWLSWLETLSGDLARAAVLAEEGVALASLTGSRTAYSWLLAQRALVHAHRGEIEECRQDCAEAASLAQRFDYALPRIWVAASLGLIELSLGNPVAAWQACEPLTLALEAHGIAEPITAFFLPEAIEALIALGHLDRAAALVELLEQRGHAVDRPWALATAARDRALLLAATGDLEEAEVAVEEALGQHRRLEMPFALARTLLVQGRIRRRQRQKRAARESLERGRDLFERLGARLWVDQAEADLSRLGLRGAPGQLTATEQRIAAMAASGLTAGDIAAALFVSRKTVEANLTRLYAKLGISSRAELGAYIATNPPAFRRP